MFAKGEYASANLFSRVIMLNAHVLGRQYIYTVFHKPIYRGVNPKTFITKSEEYEVGSIGQWPCFTSCTKNEKVAINESIES